MSQSRDLPNSGVSVTKRKQQGGGCFRIGSETVDQTIIGSFKIDEQCYCDFMNKSYLV